MDMVAMVAVEVVIRLGVVVVVLVVMMMIVVVVMMQAKIPRKQAGL